MSIVNVIKIAAKSSCKLIEHNLPLILQVTGIGGMIGGTVIAAKKAPEAKEIIEQYREEHKDDNTSKLTKIVDEIVAVGPCYVPVITIEALSITALIFSYRINMKRIAALTTALTLSDAKIKEFKSKAEEVLGVEKVEEIEKAVREEKLDGLDIVKNNIDLERLLENVGGTSIICDNETGRVFYGSIDIVNDAFYELSTRLIGEQYMTVNELYSLIGTGLGHSGAYDYLGFIADDFGKFGIKPSWSTRFAADGKTPIAVFSYDYTTNPRMRY